MRNSRNITRQLFGIVLALFAMTLGASAQVTNVWSPHGPIVFISSLALDPVNPTTIYLGTPKGIFKSPDGGANWSNIGLSNTTALAIDSVNPNILYAGTTASGAVFYPGAPFLFKSTDGGVTWSNQNSPVDFDISLLVMDPSSPYTLYAGSAIQYAGSGGVIVWKSTDGGANWNGIRTGNVGLASYGWAINPTNPQILYAPGDIYRITEVDSGLFKSTDGGANWSPTGLTNTFVRTVAMDPVNPNTLYAGTIDYGVAKTPFRGLLKSTDAGASWFPINNGLSELLSARSAVMAIVIDRASPNVIYAATSGSGVFKSSDGGANWSPLNDGLTSLNVQALVLAPDNSHTLYAGTHAGLFKIVDSATLPTTTPMDDAQFFVRQHYRDFLNREPDADGLAFWTNEITSCGGDAQCIDVKRINVSAAFYLSIEFQNTGYLVYRTYKAAYGDLPAAPVPIKLNEFLPDTQEIGQGVVVSQLGWEQVLENNKQNFAAEFVQRPRFSSAYPASLTPTEFVDKLFANAGITPSTEDRAAALNEFGSAITPSDTSARARALRRVAENSTLAQQEFNRAFVLMQYFGYLRRNPNDPPEQTLDFQGYNFWLNKLNTFYGNFTEAEMVKAFISSTEYKHRFGP